ncbi:MAG TPA: peptide ABC transporter permease [Firmicutes bacterium]|jgi:glutathione transport system permease protein|nr:peptide ABC transporter permease [Bacillota bacterium]
MGRYIARKLAVLPLIIVAVSILIFVVIRFIPGDPARLMAGMDATAEGVEVLRRKLGLDQNIIVQYWRFFLGALQGDLGTSINSGYTVVQEIATRIPYTLQLTIAAFAIAIMIGVPSGIIAAVYANSWIDQLVMVFAIIGASTPSFWIALMGMSLFSVKLRWLPLFGAGTWSHLILPSVALAMGPLALVARMSRSSMLEVMKEDYVRTARAKGLTKFRVYTKHALKNALVPVITVVGLQFGGLLAGAVATETVFSWPGIGRLLIDSVRYRDYPVIQGTVLFTVSAVVIVNSLTDIVLAMVNPRMRFD